MHSMIAPMAYRKGFIAGLLFGTVGIFLLALFGRLSPVTEWITSPFLWPGTLVAARFIGDARASPGAVAFLYLCTGMFYGIIGSVMQRVYLLHIRGKSRS